MSSPNPPTGRQADASRINMLLTKIGRSRFFVFSLLIHSIILLLLGGVAIVTILDVDPEPPGVPVFTGTITDLDDAASPRDIPSRFADLPSIPKEASSTAAQPVTLSRLIDAPLSPSGVNVPLFPFAPIISGSTAGPASTPGPRLDKDFPHWVKDQSPWIVPGPNSARDLKHTRFKFTAFLAKYSGGDWNSTVTMKGNQIEKGSLPNLLYFMRKFSSDHIDATSNPVPLNLADTEIFTIKPPFIFFTGRRNFVLTEDEVTNLRKYLMLGGAIWGDSSLPGPRSRFDIAFRREMKRLVPDNDKQFEVLPPNHPVFTRAYFPNIRAVPAGLNHYAEPVEVLRMYGEIAIIYTCNDYGDMWQIGIDEHGKADLRRDKHGGMAATDERLWSEREFYFRNLSDESLLASYQFGTNMVIHLLVRWEEVRMRGLRF